MQLKLDDTNQRLEGNETITYTNNSPDELRYLWVQLDQNVRSKDSDSHKIRQTEWGGSESYETVMKLQPSFDGGFKITTPFNFIGQPIDL